MSAVSKLLTSILLSILICTGCSFNQPDQNPPKPAANEHFWIGDVGPISASPHQEPFVCMAVREDLGQTLIDNHEGKGSAVFRETVFGPWIWGDPIGYSQNCSILTRVKYFYYSTEQEEFVELEDREDVPNDVERITINGKQINFVVRVEIGTINRFFYTIAMLAPFEESLDTPQTLNNSAWNGKLVYKFQGGVGIGHWQGRLRLDHKHSMHYASLKQGYAVAFSSGTSTASHYNLKLAEETAQMLKHHFTVTYGKPRYTVGLGGSGGAIQQYVLGQNNTALLDAAIPQLSFPDMVTQISYVADCDLLERYFDEKYQQAPNSKWGDWLFRAKIQGVNANTESLENGRFENPMAPSPGASTCSRSWRGHIQNIMNPEWAHPAYKKALDIFHFPEQTYSNTKWTHWNDLEDIYPQDAQGFAANTWDNIGVQYGLRALRRGDLNIDEFLELNACVGSWKPIQQQRLGKYPWNEEADEGHPDHWDVLNMQLSPDCKTDQPAPRHRASDEAIRMAHERGQVFEGEINIPVIDLRWYLDPILDIHHAVGSFSARARIEHKKGHHNNQLIWFAECKSLDPKELGRDCPFDPTAQALSVLDEWLIKGKPATASDTCFAGDGEVIYSGNDAWDGILNNHPPGKCSQQFPIHTTSRIEAGEDFSGERLKCKLKPVNQAIAEGDYGQIRFNEQHIARLKTIFPEGVCGY